MPSSTSAPSEWHSSSRSRVSSETRSSRCARDYYLDDSISSLALFTSISFDLTITSFYLPLCSGRRMVIYPETSQTRDLALYTVAERNEVDLLKLTPSHLALLLRAGVAK